MKSPPNPVSIPARQVAARWTAALVGGPTDLLDFLVPLWAGSALGLDARAVGLLVAAELLVSFAARFPAGLLADACERRSVAAAGAALYGASCVGYALSSGPALAFAAAALGGIGGALFWVSVRSIVGEWAGADTLSFPRLMAWQETGSWVAFVAGLTLLSSLEFQGVFLAAAAACFAAVAVIASTPRHHTATARQPRSKCSRRRLRPMLAATALTSLAEAAIGLLLLLHLQHAFALNVVSIALVFLPGAVAMSLLPQPAHRLTMHLGRRRVAAIAALSSATFATTLAFAPSPTLIAALWILSAASWAAIIPIEQSVIAEITAEQVGTGFGLYESARLAGAGIGALLAGVSYAATSWQVACILFAAITGAGAIATPWALHRLGANDFPTAAAIADSSTARRDSDIPTSPIPDGRDHQQKQEETTVATPKTHRSKLTDLGWHFLLFALAQVALAIMGWSWVADSFRADNFGEHLASGGRPELEGFSSFVYGAGKIWVIVFVIDVIWTLVTVRAGSHAPDTREE